MKTKIVEFDSISALARAVEATKGHKALNASASESDRSYDWDMGESLKGALTIGLNGGLWDEGAKELQSVSIASATEQLADIIQPAMINDVTGGAVDIGAYLSDDPECFFRLDDEQTVKPIIKIGVCSVPCHNIDSHELMNQGRAIMAVIDALELQGYSTELDSYIIFCEKGKKNYMLKTAVKEAGHPWDAASVAYALAHPAFSRRLGFKMLESDDEYSDITSCGYGSGRIDTPAGLDLYFPYLDKPAVVRTPENALDYVKQVIKDQNPNLLLNDV